MNLGQSATRSAWFCARNSLGMACAFSSSMTKPVVHLERKSRFLGALTPINPCEDIHFGMVDCISIGVFLFGFVGMICTLAN
jgi:hypothetical protein